MDIITYAMWRALSAGESGGGGVVIEESETINADVGVDLSSFFEFASSHKAQDGWRLDVVSNNISYPIQRLASRIGSSSGSSVFVYFTDYSSLTGSNQVTFCKFNSDSHVITSINDSQKGSVFIRAYKINYEAQIM